MELVGVGLAGQSRARCAVLFGFGCAAEHGKVFSYLLFVCFLLFLSFCFQLGLCLLWFF